jgi:DNA-binding winged helix-turn-helix (wHTH) protein
MRIEFDPFVLDDDCRELLRQGVEIHLSPKAYELLKLLLQLRPRAVSKEELHRRLWSGTHVSEATLTALVSEVREALGESGQRHGRIRTVHGFGYAFAGTAVTLADAPVPVGVEPAADAPQARQAETPGASSATRQRPGKAWMAVPLLFAAALSVAGYMARRARSTPSPTEPPAILIASVDDRSGFPAWDGELERALAIAIWQSRAFVLVDEMRQGVLLSEMGHSLSAPVTREVARELCRRARAKALVEGAVVRAGQAYILGLDAEECETGVVVARDQRQVSRQEDVLPVFSGMASSLSKKLTERFASVQ